MMQFLLEFWFKLGITAAAMLVAMGEWFGVVPPGEFFILLGQARQALGQ